MMKKKIATMTAALLGIAGACVFSTPVVSSESMSPTLVPGHHVLVAREAFMLHRRFQRGDVVILRSHKQRGALLVKRIVALPGDRICIKKGVVFLNGSAMREPYAHYRDSYWRNQDEWPLLPLAMKVGDVGVTVPLNMLFLLGDYRSESSDSRTWGFVPFSDVEGRVIAQLL